MKRLRLPWVKEFRGEFETERPALIKEIVRQMLKKKSVIFALFFLIFFFTGGIFGPFFAPYGYEEIDYQHVREGPSFEHWFGTDLIGRDLFTRILYSMRTTILLSVLVVLFGGITIGVTLGLISGYYGGWIDELIMRIGEILNSIPAFILFLFLSVSLRPRYEEFLYSLGSIGEWFVKEGIVDFMVIFLVFSLFYWMGSARVIRSQTLSLKTMPYIDASRVLGGSSRWIIFHHILPNVLGIIILWVFSTVSYVALSEVALSWLGLGIRPPRPSFGAMLSEISSVRLLMSYPHLLLFPGVMVALYIFSFWKLEKELNQIFQSLYTKGSYPARKYF